MISLNLRDDNLRENIKAIEELKRLGTFSEGELQELYNKQVEADKLMVEGSENDEHV